ncbi:MAG: hypothetical protein QOH31_2570 [Verrucomicrobiota bacterium]|jgi:hypothetical protein
MGEDTYQDSDFEDISGLSISDIDWTSTDVHTSAASSANRRIKRARAAPVHVLFFFRPMINALRAWVLVETAG